MRLLAPALAVVFLVGLLAPPAHAEPAKTLDDARGLHCRGAYADALRALETLLATRPDDVAAWRLAQDLQHLLGPLKGDTKFEPSAKTPASIRRGLEARRLPAGEAVAVLTALLAEEGVSPLFRLDLATALIGAGRGTQAEKEIARYLDAHPDDAEAYALKGKGLSSRGKFANARTAYERALAIAPGRADATQSLAHLLVKARKNKAARALLEGAVKRYPENPLLLLALADDRIRTGEATAAVAGLQSVLALPGKVGKGRAHASLAEAYRRLKQYEEAGASARKAIAADPECVSALRTLGFVKQKRKDYDGALEAYGKVKRLRPEWPQIYVDIGFVLTLKDDRAKARRSLEDALKLDKKHVDAHVRMGVYYYLGKDYKQAGKHLETALKQDRDNVPANRYMGYVLLAEGKPKKAVKHFETVADLRPKDASSMRMVGRALIEIGKLDKAVEALRVAVGRNNKDAFSFFDLGKALAKQERFEDAEAAYRKAVELEPTLTHPYLYLAELLDDVQGDAEKALPYYKKYVELGGTDKGGSIEKRIEQIEKSLEKK